MRSFLFLILLAAACGSGTTRAGDGGAADLGGSGSRCQTAADCRLYSSYCSTNPCVCLAIGRNEVDPPCPAGPQSCVVDPCTNKRADCVGGACVVK